MDFLHLNSRIVCAVSKADAAATVKHTEGGFDLFF